MVVPAELLTSAHVVQRQDSSFLRTEKSPKFRNSTPRDSSQEQNLPCKEIHTWCYRKPNIYWYLTLCNASNPITYTKLTESQFSWVVQFIYRRWTCVFMKEKLPAWRLYPLVGMYKYMGLYSVLDCLNLSTPRPCECSRLYHWSFIVERFGNLIFGGGWGWDKMLDTTMLFCAHYDIDWQVTPEAHIDVKCFCVEFKGDMCNTMEGGNKTQIHVHVRRWHWELVCIEAQFHTAA